jgi:hypothetical protein
VTTSSVPSIGPITLRGRTFSGDELARIRAIVDGSKDAVRPALSRTICEALGWYQSNGQPKERSCRDVLRNLHIAGFLSLPTPRRAPKRRRPIALTVRTAPRASVMLQPREVTLADLRIVNASTDKSTNALWNEYVARYHYLGYGTPVGPNIKYVVARGEEPIACMIFSGAAWKVRCRDEWIGWTSAQRETNLRFIINNSRFLILPWIRAKNLASRTLALAARRLPDDWHHIYGYRPLLLETFVHTERHAGTCYRAANWIYVGETAGRGRMDRHKKRELPRKAMFLYPLNPDSRIRLATLGLKSHCAEQPRTP